MKVTVICVKIQKYLLASQKQFQAHFFLEFITLPFQNKLTSGDQQHPEDCQQGPKQANQDTSDPEILLLK